MEGGRDRHVVEGEGQGARELKTYITQVFHDIVVLFSLFVLVAFLFDSFQANKVFGDFRPHAIFLRFLGFEAPAYLCRSRIDNGEFTALFLLHAFAASDAVEMAAGTCFALKHYVIIVVAAIAFTTTTYT